MKTGHRILLFVWLLGMTAGLASPASARAAAAPATTTPIKHVVSLMQSNHTFDSYFGVYPGADGVPAHVCMPVDPTDPANSTCVKPFHLENNGADLNHSFQTFLREYRAGRMDGFIYAFRQRGEDGTVAMGHYDDSDIPLYWNLADDYVLFDRFFSSATGGSVPNRMFWVTGTAGISNMQTVGIPAQGWGDLPTIFDRLQAKGISWKFYVENYNPTINYRNRGVGSTSAQFNWVPLLSYGRYLDDPALSSHIVDLSQYFRDVATNQLPAVSYIVTVGSSEHPPSNVATGQRLVKQMLNSLMESPAWDSTAFTVTYDDWGGWYDHVPPPRVDDYGYGFRVPALLISPYAKRGVVDHTVLDFTSILKFIEQNFGLASLATRDAQANSLSSAFDFSAPPRRPSIVATTRDATSLRQPNRTPIYVTYSLALAVPIAIIAIALTDAMGRRPRRRWRLPKRSHAS